jgi:hypothetical protein
LPKRLGVRVFAENVLAKISREGLTGFVFMSILLDKNIYWRVNYGRKYERNASKCVGIVAGKCGADKGID